MLLFQKTYGALDRKPLVILHGLLGTLDNWHTLAGKISQWQPVIAMDLRNHGQSPHDATMSFELMAGDVLETLDNMGVSEFDVLGHSMGGKVAMRLALDQPQRVQRLVVVDIAPKLYPPHHNSIFKALFAVNLDRAETRTDVEQVLATYIADPGVRLFLMKNLTRNEAGKFAWKMNLQALYNNYDQIVAAITAPPVGTQPALFIGGAKSNYILPEDHAPIRELFPAAQLETVANAGHWVHAEQPEALLAILSDWMQWT